MKYTQICVLKVSAGECRSIPLNNTQQHPSQESTNFWLFYIYRLTFGQLWTNCWLSINLVLTENHLRCPLSIDWDDDREYRSTLDLIHWLCILQKQSKNLLAILTLLSVSQYGEVSVWDYPVKNSLPVSKHLIINEFENHDIYAAKFRRLINLLNKITGRLL